MENTRLIVKQSLSLSGTVDVSGAKNAVLVIMASLLLTRGKSVLKNVPASADVSHMIKLLEQLGAQVGFEKDAKIMHVDTSFVDKYKVSPEIMNKMRASVLVMGPLLAHFGQVDLALPGGCIIGARPIDYHLKNFERMGVDVEIKGSFLCASVKKLTPQRLVLEYPSVGATENLLMAATCTIGTTHIVNAALEPEVLDLVDVLKKMGARITIHPPATIEIEGVCSLHPIEHEIVFDRLEAGTLILATAITGGQLTLPNANGYLMETFLSKLDEMGHSVSIGKDGNGIVFRATKSPRAVSFKTSPYPGFPTDLQAQTMANLCLCQGKSLVQETVFENRLLHVRELEKMGAQVSVECNMARVSGVEELYGAEVIATDIRASAALVIAGLAAKGTTIIKGVHHWKRGYEKLEDKLTKLGANIWLEEAGEKGVFEPVVNYEKISQEAESF
ncbi:UDP-N-acetylglucosamine 1-carboxyvinyltransferase [bacterium]|jgi:UDP-N-acetylglucosamine 1-carboxyvinyltransferase|nr:UDP-N-acetylglucosamine 1-carboxyvinyltransferase [bacterium]